ncbi:hypothetical protein D3C73_1284930 [compost metagenome]
MLRMLEAHQDMQGVLAQRGFDQHYPITHLLGFALQVVARHELIFHCQIHPPCRQHAHGGGKVAYRHLVQAGVAIEFG